MLNLDLRSITACSLAALALIVGSGEAEAGLSLGIIVNPTVIIPTGDPLAEYDFKLTLVANNEILQGDNVTILNVPDYDGVSSYVFMSGGINYSSYFSIIATPGSSAGLTNIELELTAPPPAALVNPDMVNNLPIGDLFVETSDSFPPPTNSPLFNSLTYTTQTHIFSTGALNTGTGMTGTPNVVPEPASVALVGVGLASAWLLARRRRSRGISLAS